MIKENREKQERMEITGVVEAKKSGGLTVNNLKCLDDNKSVKSKRSLLSSKKPSFMSMKFKNKE